MKWVNLSERQPDNLNHAHVRWAKSKDKAYFYDYEVRLFDKEVQLRFHENHYPPIAYGLDELEWLDESKDRGYSFMDAVREGKIYNPKIHGKVYSPDQVVPSQEDKVEPPTGQVANNGYILAQVKVGSFIVPPKYIGDIPPNLIKKITNKSYKGKLKGRPINPL